MTSALPHRTKSAEEFKDHIHAEFVSKIDSELLKRLPIEQQRTEIRSVLDNLIAAEPQPLGLVEKRRLVDDLLDEILGFGPLEKVLRDPTVSEFDQRGATRLRRAARAVLEKIGLVASATMSICWKSSGGSSHGWAAGG